MNNAMTNRERERLTLDFGKPDRGVIQETFYPWTLTVDRYEREGIAPSLCEGLRQKADGPGNQVYFQTAWGQGVLDYERALGFDPVRRIHFLLPFRHLKEEVLEENSRYTLRRDSFGRQLIRKAGSTLELVHRNVVCTAEDWEKLKALGDEVLERAFTDDAIDAAYAGLKPGHDRGDYSIRLHLEGFFWMQRELLGDEEHLMMFYEDPDLLHDIADYMCGIYETKLMRVIRMLQPDVVYFMEDLSGKNGPMISGRFVDEFVGTYYRRLIPMMKRAGVGNVFVDTDGDFAMIIPNFMAAGVDGFLPMDVNAGMDIVAVRRRFPCLKFIGGFNKLRIQEGRAAIDAEFARILPVIRGGGYIAGNDHQVPPSAPLALYRYYIEALGRAMAQAGADL